MSSRKNHPPRPQITMGGKYSVGADLGAEPVPVMLIIEFPNGYKLPSFWSVEDAEGIAYSLLKYIELVRRERLKLVPWKVKVQAPPQLAPGHDVSVQPQQSTTPESTDGVARGIP